MLSTDLLYHFRLTDVLGQTPRRREDMFLIGDVLIDCSHAPHQSMNTDSTPIFSPSEILNTTNRQCMEPYEVIVYIILMLID